MRLPDRRSVVGEKLEGGAADAPTVMAILLASESVSVSSGTVSPYRALRMPPSGSMERRWRSLFATVSASVVEAAVTLWRRLPQSRRHRQSAVPPTRKTHQPLVLRVLTKHPPSLESV